MKRSTISVFANMTLLYSNCLTHRKLDFDFRRPTRFVDLEGDTTLLVDPSEISDRYQKALAEHLNAINAIVLESAVDLSSEFGLTKTTNRCCFDSLPVESKGVTFDEFFAARTVDCLAGRLVANHHSLDQSTSISDGELGRDAISVGGQQDIARLCEDSPLADLGCPGGRDRSA